MTYIRHLGSIGPDNTPPQEKTLKLALLCLLYNGLFYLWRFFDATLHFLGPGQQGLACTVEPMNVANYNSWFQHRLLHINTIQDQMNNLTASCISTMKIYCMILQSSQSFCFSISVPPGRVFHNNLRAPHPQSFSTPQHYFVSVWHSSNVPVHQ